MLISPPFLPARLDNMTDDEWLALAMSDDPQGLGKFPISFNLGWHGGMHLEAPMEDGRPLLVRAVADGEVVYRSPTITPVNEDPDAPLNFGGSAGTTPWTSDGCVVIRHTTEIGVNAEAEAVEVTFFSVYMHLHFIAPTVRAGRPIYRKDEIGEAGYIYGSPNLLHFEIICDDDNLRRLVGRNASDLQVTQDGRVDSVYGSIYFYLPAGTQLYAYEGDARPPAHMAAPPEPAALATTEDLYVELQYAEGQGATGEQGNAYLTTYQQDGSALGGPLSEEDAEYNLYREANRIVDAFRAARMTPLPAPSAVYELLRFGRILGPDALNPPTTPHWRKIRYVEGTYWVNLNAASVRKFSDADFPHWKGWLLVDDSADQDSRCDSTTIRSWLDQNGDGRISLQETTARLREETIQRKLARVIAKYPTEWEATSIESRWGWLKAASPERPEPLSEADFGKLRAHLEALCFWQRANLAIPASHWHFHPREFIQHFRKCGWLSVDEFARCIPRKSLLGNLNWTVARSRSVTHSRHLNGFFRKYLGASPTRKTHALTQIHLETGLLSLMNEIGSGARMPYGPFYGRGYKQLTWLDNYKKYGEFKAIQNQVNLNYSDARITPTSTHPIDSSGRSIQWAPRYDPAIVSNDLLHAAESSGFYWITKRFRGLTNMNRVCDLPFSPTSVAFNCWLINGGANGYANRQQLAQYLRNVLSDSPPLQGSHQFSYPPLTPVMAPALCSTFPPREIQYTLNNTVHYDMQTP